MFNSRAGRIFTATTISLFSLHLLHAQAKAQPAPSSGLFSNGMFLIMLCVMILLLFVILALAEVVKAGAMQERIRFRAAKKKSEEGNNENAKKVAGTLLLLFATTWLSAQQAAAPAVTPAAAPFDYWGMGTGVFYTMLFTIIVEMGIALMLFRSGMQLIGVKKKAVKAGKPEPGLMEKLNASVALEEEEAILMDHDYDGIRELDNDLPPWWKYGFYATIVFAVIYFVHFHVTHTGKSSLEEYAQEVREGDSAVAEYKRTAKDLIDETSVTLLTDAGSLRQGKDIFTKNCTGCHGEKGEGNIGPNFTDDYWIHGGSISNVYKSIRDGYIDKGMKAWGAEMKPSDIQLVASFIKSLRGTNPSNAKAAEGELYTEGGKPGGNDSAQSRPDTLKK